MNASTLRIIITILVQLISMGLLRIDGDPEPADAPEPRRGKRAEPDPEPTWEDLDDDEQDAAEAEAEGAELWTDGAAAAPADAIETVCGSGKRKGCGGTFYRLRSEGKTCPACKAKRATRKAGKGKAERTRSEPVNLDPADDGIQERTMDATEYLRSFRNDPAALAALLLAQADEQASQSVKRPVIRSEQAKSAEAECRRCGRLFLRKVPHQKDCSPECARETNRLRMARNRKPSRAGKLAGWVLWLSLAGLATLV